jgi:hypothetical protein
LNVHEAGGVWQTEMHTAVLFVPEPSDCQAEVAIRNLKSCKQSGVDQIPVELI